MDKPFTKNNLIKVLSFSLGFSSISAQIIYLREFITVFYGNEVTYSFIIAAWLFWVGAGSFAAGFVTKRIENPHKTINCLFISLGIILPFTLFLIRNFKNLLGVYPGQVLDIITAVLSVSIIITPVTILFGALFTLLCLLTERKKDDSASFFSANQVYLIESIGSAIGGMFFSLFLIRFVSPSNMILILAHLSFLTAWVFPKTKTIKAIAGVLMVTAIIGFLSNQKGGIEKWLREKQWKGFNLIEVAESIYGNIALTESEGKYSLFENGHLSFTAADELTSEENVHYALLQNPKQERVLLIGNGFGGNINEALKYKSAKIDYVELDDKIVDVLKRNMPVDKTAFLTDSRLTVIHEDARFLIKQKKKKYDSLIVSLGDPRTALINRYFTLEFFKEAKDVLSSSGVFSVSVSSSENYLGEEAKRFLRSINTTLSEVFCDVKSVPGDTNIFIASPKCGNIGLNPEVLIERLKENNINNKFVNEYYLPFKLSKGRIDYINTVLEENGEINTDNRPVAYLYNIVLWSTHFNDSFKNIISRVSRINLLYYFLFPVFLFIIGIYFVKSKKLGRETLVNYSVATTGFCEIIIQVIVILAFQSFYGYAYY
ncbi:MAG: hypothetical protein HQL27_04685, partial [Candidatus Omnitrophica bacterium]|nr:hypothetical protein [Candidatus Omnitrophota bacterium]